MLTLLAMMGFWTGVGSSAITPVDICRGVVAVTDNSVRTQIAANGYAVTVTDNSTRTTICG